MSDEKTAVEDITGKKVFFLNPTNSIKNQVVTELIQQEIEVYTIKDHAKLFRILKKHPNSIVYVNLDEGIPESEWEKWISMVFTAVPSVKMGIFSSSSDEELKNKYTKKMNITCGFLGLKLDMSKTAVKILEIFSEMNVKGRRKYLRATVDRDTIATINLPHDGDFINGVIRDASVVGVSCVFDRDPGLKKNALHKDIQIRLQTMLLKVEAVVFGSREEYGQVIYVLLFTQRTDPDVRVKIRKYIQQTLQTKMDQETG